MDNKELINKFGYINNISTSTINHLSGNNVKDNDVLERTELIMTKLIEIRLHIINRK